MFSPHKKINCKQISKLWRQLLDANDLCCLYLFSDSSIELSSIIYSLCWWRPTLYLFYCAWLFNQHSSPSIHYWFSFQLSVNLLSLNQSKTEFLLIGLSKQLSNISDPTFVLPSNVTISPANCVRNLSVIFDCTNYVGPHYFHLFLTIVSFRSWPSQNRKHSWSFHHGTRCCHTSHQVDCCNSQFLNLPRAQLDRLELVLFSAARAVSKTKKSHFTRPQIFTSA